MKLRTVFFWIHLTAGATAGTVILIMSVTGALLTFQQSVLKVVERSQRYVEALGTPRLDLDAIVASVRQARPDATPTTVTLESDPAAAAAVQLGTQGMLFVNPYTGQILGTGATRARAFYRSVTNWHRWLAVEGESRATARAFTGASNLAFLGLALSGVYLWWPRQLTLRHLAPVTWFRRGLSGKARDFNWHNVIGSWCAPVIVVLTLTGTVMSYSWANDLVYTLTGSPLPSAGRGGGSGRGEGAARGDAGGERARVRGEGGEERQRVRNEEAPRPAAPLESLFARAAQQVPTWRTMIVRLPMRAGGPVAFSISDREYWNSFARSTLTLNGSTGADISWEPYAATSIGQKLRGWMRFAHTGELGGLAGELAAGLASAGGAFLVWTGISLALRRLSAWRARRRAAVPAGAEAPAASAEANV